jgi:GLPGLI family protein
MKKSALIITVVMFFLNIGSFAQKAISEGIFTYNISIQSAGNEPAAAANPLNGATSIIYIKGAFSRIDMASNLGNEKTIHDTKSGTAVILKEYSGQKLMITLTKENWQEKNKGSEGIIFTDQNEKKEILGYQCTKAISKLNDGSVLTVFYTKDILVQNKEYNPLFKNLAGVPMLYEVESGKMKFVYTMTKIDLNAIPQTKFDYPKSGYRVITYDENKQGIKK